MVYKLLTFIWDRSKGNDWFEGPQNYKAMNDTASAGLPRDDMKNVATFLREKTYIMPPPLNIEKHTFIFFENIIKVIELL